MRRKENPKPLVTISLVDNGISLDLSDDISGLIEDTDLEDDEQPSSEIRKMAFLPVLASAIADLTAKIAREGADADDIVDYALDCVQRAFETVFPEMAIFDDDEEEEQDEDILAALPPELWRIARYEINRQPMYQCVCLQLKSGDAPEKFDTQIFRDKEMAIRRCAALNGFEAELPIPSDG